MIEIENLTIEYDNISESVLKNLNFSFSDEKIVIIGSNGSGKTTFFKSLLGLVPIKSGSIKIHNIPLTKINSLLDISTNIVDVYKLIFLPIKDLIRVYANLKGGDPNEAFNYFKEFELEGIFNKKLHNLSAGQQKMFCNILAICFSPNIVLLDEPFENLDQNRRNKFLSLINLLNCSIMIITHEMYILSFLTDFKFVFLLDKSIFGKFSITDIERMYITKGKVEGAIIIETSKGTFSLTLDNGDYLLKTITNIDSILGLE